MRIRQNVAVFADQKPGALSGLLEHLLRLTPSARQVLTPLGLLEEPFRKLLSEQVEGVVEVVLHVPHRNLLLHLNEHDGRRGLGSHCRKALPEVEGLLLCLCRHRQTAHANDRRNQQARRIESRFHLLSPPKFEKQGHNLTHQTATIWNQ